jgi:hypothetical protein
LLFAIDRLSKFGFVLPKPRGDVHAGDDSPSPWRSLPDANFSDGLDPTGSMSPNGPVKHRFLRPRIFNFHALVIALMDGGNFSNALLKKLEPHCGLGSTEWLTGNTREFGFVPPKSR